ncbi:hypothetical protein THAOC_24510 [Thalassiosira oceanica]|uniref:Uncharacterized protein n=1 Tax=Thalassiosira oceanica TaxID=159749 RepID=K0S489_THAOC|nr:hypothetical protein THAOC_24510 [Thalassiosira oceanica]|eukprot:EJK55726.1 hypothetical protein THAOC_24510 [Thalassiosira oceanica]
MMASTLDLFQTTIQMSPSIVRGGRRLGCRDRPPFAVGVRGRLVRLDAAVEMAGSTSAGDEGTASSELSPGVAEVCPHAERESAGTGDVVPAAVPSRRRVVGRVE